MKCSLQACKMLRTIPGIPAFFYLAIGNLRPLTRTAPGSAHRWNRRCEQVQKREPNPIAVKITCDPTLCHLSLTNPFNLLPLASVGCSSRNSCARAQGISILRWCTAPYIPVQNPLWTACTCRNTHRQKGKKKKKGNGGHCVDCLEQRWRRWWRRHFGVIRGVGNRRKKILPKKNVIKVAIGCFMDPHSSITRAAAANMSQVVTAPTVENGVIP